MIFDKILPEVVAICDTSMRFGIRKRYNLIFQVGKSKIFLRSQIATSKRR